MAGGVAAAWAVSSQRSQERGSQPGMAVVTTTL
jgi:hypothetical protein